MQSTRGRRKLRKIESLDDILQVERMVGDNLEMTLDEEGVDPEAYFKVFRQRRVWLVLMKLRFVWGRFLEAFVWEEDGKVIGTGTVRRASFGDARRWMLGNFAVSLGSRSELGLLLILRRLAQRCVAHALAKGAEEIWADIPVETEALIRGLEHDGFTVIDELCYFRCARGSLRDLAGAATGVGAVSFRRASAGSTPRWMDITAGRLVGFRSRAFEVREGERAIAQVQLVSHPGSSLPRSVIEPRERLSTRSGKLLLACVGDLAPEESSNLVVVVPRSTEGLFAVLNGPGVGVEVSRRKRLCLLPREVVS